MDSSTVRFPVIRMRAYWKFMKGYTMDVHRYYQRTAVILRQNPGKPIYIT